MFMRVRKAPDLLGFRTLGDAGKPKLNRGVILFQGHGAVFPVLLFSLLPGAMVGPLIARSIQAHPL